MKKHIHIREIEVWLSTKRIRYDKISLDLCFWLDNQERYRAVVRHDGDIKILLADYPEFAYTIHSRPFADQRLQHFEEAIAKLRAFLSIDSMGFPLVRRFPSHQVELRIKTNSHAEISYEFKSLRFAYAFMERCIDLGATRTYFKHSRIYTSKQISKDWLMVAADSNRDQMYLMRFQPPSEQGGDATESQGLHPHLKDVKERLNALGFNYEEQDGALSIVINHDGGNRVIVTHHQKIDALVFTLQGKPDYINVVDCKGNKSHRLMQFSREILKLKSQS